MELIAFLEWLMMLSTSLVFMSHETNILFGEVFFLLSGFFCPFKNRVVCFYNVEL